ncbi:class I SAM-dependent methyltransferase [Clostridium estertheticum]|uniref:class I SAM-dependent methyltransferase n=1 Tax=Clostridium estertheticum TaxID=238834 RepID=UPI0013E94DCE|nr:class I SAM-dependent methyltransferase [Clostridium estertheticum]MBZ9685594.1 class I SAM-dependent methyltransferase [Clostridium estertheticum]
MEKINYNETCKIYDLVREEDMVTIRRIIEEGKINCNSTVLEIGCGTGNYAVTISKCTEAQVYGMDQSEGMLEKAEAKGSKINFIKGDAGTLEGFEDNYFDVIYMVDVLHHIKDINTMLKNIYRILKKEGKIFIFTDSYENIKNRLTTKYFPETLEVELERYQSTEEIFEAMKDNGFHSIKADNLDIGYEEEAGEKLIKIAETQGYSMFNLISQEAINRGIERLNEDLKKANISYQAKASYISANK